MKKMSIFKKVSALVMALVLVYSMPSVAGLAEVAAAGSVKSVSVTNLPAKTLTLKKGKAKVLKVKVNATKGASTKFTYKTSNKKIVTVKSAKGGVKVTAKAAGTANVTITSKANKKKSVVIKVTVGTPVSKLKVNKTKSNVLKNGTLNLKVTVSPSSASNKKVVWSTSNKSIATVSSKGVVKGKKVGTATITGVAADGSGKKVTCKVTVKKANKVNKFEILNSYTARLTLDSPQKLSSSKFSLKKKAYKNGKYIKDMKIFYVESEDNQVYDIGFESHVNINDYVQLTVKGVKGAAKKVVKEDLYNRKDYKIVDTYTYEAKTGEYLSRSLSGTYMHGYTKVTVKKLPKGIKYNSEENRFYGTPTKAGKTTSTCTLKDEQGNKKTVKIVWVIGSSSKMYGTMEAGYYLVNKEKPVYVSMPIYVSGGSGQYTYKIVSDGGLKLDVYDDGVHGQVTKAKTYTIKVKVTDANNSSRSVIVSNKLYVKNGKTVSLTLKDRDGKAINNYMYIYLENNNLKDKYCQYAESYTSDAKGVQKFLVTSGTYQIVVERDNFTKITEKKISGSSSVSVKLPVNTITLKYSGGNSKLDHLEWYDESGEHVGYGSKLILKNGSYKLTAEVKEGFTVVKYTVSFKVSGKNMSKSVKRTSKTPTYIYLNNPLVKPLKYQETYFKFTPAESGTYIFTSSTQSYMDTYGTLYDVNGGLLAQNDDGADNGNFRIEHYCQAGQTYVLGARTYYSSTNTGNATISVTKVVESTE